MTNPLVSAVIPAYNYGHFVTDAVACALAQTYSPMEVIVVDDGSTDDTRERLAPYMNRISYIYQENKGLPAARNTGIRHAHGEWVALLDADDLWHSQKTEVQLNAVASMGDLGIVGSQKNVGLPADLPANPEVRRLEVRDFLVQAPVTSSSVLLRKRCVAEVGWFNESLTSAEDRDMWLRMAARFPAVQVVSPCWTYRTHGGQMSRNVERMLSNTKSVVNRFCDEHSQYDYLRSLGISHGYLEASFVYLTEHDRLNSINMMIYSLIKWPWSYGGRMPATRWPRLKIMTRALVGEGLFKLASRSRGRSLAHQARAG
jgi:glycosyltransferase involved in cell wall biosynthesis